MRLGIVGLPGSGKSTIFQALTGSKVEQGAHKGSSIATVQVPDQRVDALSGLFKPEKTVFARLEYLLPSGTRSYVPDGQSDESFWSEARPCDALIHVVRNFHQPGGEDPRPRDDFLKLETDMIFADLMVVERRIERLDQDNKRGKETDAEERQLLEACLSMLEAQGPLRDDRALAGAHQLKGYTFLSAKPLLLLFSNDDEDKSLPAWDSSPELLNALVIRGKLEMELAELPPEEAEEFSTAYQIEGFARDRVILHSCNVLGLIAFFTVVNKEVRSWMIPRGTPALEAADVIHSDMKRGFIRAEVIPCEDLLSAGSYQNAKKEGKVRLEGKTYVVQDGDLITFHFNV
ncbi:MAG: redox-regulated ATPase YchF [Deltaproteobacteria bacterium]|nr:redox-regulated ATPase YchF [Deltaproteobacteria bacterium]